MADQISINILIVGALLLVGYLMYVYLSGGTGALRLSKEKTKHEKLRRLIRHNAELEEAKKETDRLKSILDESKKQTDVSHLPMGEN